VADFLDTDLTGSRFERVDLTGAQVHRVRLYDASFRGVGFRNVVMRGVELQDVHIYGELENVTINGVEVWPLISAELDRRYPDRAKMRPTDPAGFRDAWDVVERIWAETVARARRLDPALVHESVGGEWSFIETLRHLSFATECWLLRAILGDPNPYAALSLPWDGMPDTDGVPRDRAARPSLDEALALRLDRQAAVRRYVDALDDATLAADTVPVEGPGWPEPVSFPVRECLLMIFNEEWWHRQFALRDLALLEQRAG